MSDRSDFVDDFIAGSAWADWQRHPLAGDASSRRYERLSSGSQSVILMDAPDDAPKGIRRFADMVAVLEQQGLFPPSVLAHSTDTGIMVLSDLGPLHFAAWLVKRPADEHDLYSAAIDVLARLHEVRAPELLSRITPDVAAQMVEISGTYYAECDVSDLAGEMKLAMATYAPVAETLALRDFHAENLIWRPSEKGMKRVGLLDFQDAFIAPAGYDLISLLRDARRDVPPEIVEMMITRFIEQTGSGPEMRAQLACLGAQRNLRILGVFGRLAREMGKRSYVDLLPRVWYNLMCDLDHPALANLRQATLETLPPPTDDLLHRLRQ
ncbi:aminoglycoside phosphotransferase family protein [Loktanella agnita]|uniref:aminoglycoside phosphotransferase family protein n=1 Tax=Loktanella agnita TaxID=287097 RepID=UPI0039874869